jgi:hypothetical protein
MINKATYDPELDQQIADEASAARDARTAARKAVAEATSQNTKLIQNAALTPQGSTLALVQFTQINDWLDANTTAKSVDILDKIQNFKDALLKIYTDDKARLVFYNWIQFWKVTQTSLATDNKISTDKSTSLKSNIDTIDNWYTKNQNESIQTYQDKINTVNATFYTIIADSQIIADVKAKEALLKNTDATKTIAKMKETADQAALDKAALDEQTFSVSRTAGKAATNLGYAILAAVLVAFGLIAGSTAANDAIARSVSFRIVYFVYAFIFSIPVLIYYTVMYFYYKKSVTYLSYILPLYEYDPATTTAKESFFEKCVWYARDATVAKAVADLAAAEAALRAAAAPVLPIIAKQV